MGKVGIIVVVLLLIVVIVGGYFMLTADDVVGLVSDSLNEDSQDTSRVIEPDDFVALDSTEAIFDEIDSALTYIE